MSRSSPINVTQAFLPPREELDALLDSIWKSRQLTNNGPLSRDFERTVSDYLGIYSENFRFVANGTLALQLALRALNITSGEIITTPFTYVATISAIMWEHCTPVFVDIDPETLNIDPKKIEAAITPNTKAIMPVHVFGNPCDVGGIQKVANKHNLKVIYDAAHAFGVQLSGRSLLSFGDVSTCSFHATKLFHTIEGGAVYAKDPQVIDRVELLKRFGHQGDDHIILGINAKATEFSAAMGLANLKYINDIIADRKKTTELYDSYLGDKFTRPKIGEDVSYNYAYYPIIFDDETVLMQTKEKLEKENIFPRRYFYPSLNKLPYVDSRYSCPISESISRRILCLPLYYKIEDRDIRRVCKIVSSKNV